MAKEEIYEATINCSVYKEDVEIKRIDITPGRVDLEFEDGHKEVWYSKEESIRQLKKQYKFIKRG